MLSEQTGYRKRLHKLQLRARNRQPCDQGLESLLEEVGRAVERCRVRRERLPVPDYPEALPVCERRDDIRRAIAEHQVVVIAGETGSGKTTQIPKICLELGRGVSGMIGHTQPRRIAARSVAERIASELKGELGHAVGYQVRFHDQVSSDTYIKLMTDGILLAEIQQDRDLSRYDTIIIDEAHERGLNIDFLLGYLKQLLPRRPELKLIITSATIDTERFARHFSSAECEVPVVEVSGRTFPVEVRYRPLSADDDEQDEQDLVGAIVDAVDEVSRIDRGDVLVFLSGEREIRETAEALRKHHPPNTEILPLFARLSVADQNRVFQPHGRRRIILATNVAETSLTVPGIRYVVDSGYARISRYSYRSKVQRLPVERISQASANQRKGRCGRVSEGVCIRLYSEESFEARKEFTEPEILRTNLAAVILRMKVLGLGEVAAFPFVEAPEERLIKDGYRLLHELGAVDRHNRLTRTGRELARFPIDPRVGRMLLASRHEGALAEVLVIASALSVQDPRERPMDAQEKADQAHAEFRNEESDFLSYLLLWNIYHEQARHLSKSKLRKWCTQRFVSWRRMREWLDIYQQLKRQVREMGMALSESAAEPDAIHRALLAGLLGNIGCKSEGREYSGGQGKKFFIFPGSALRKKAPKWLVAAELVETTRLYARTVAGIQPQWIEPLARHLVKRSYSEAHWERRGAQVAAFEQVTLYGLVIVPKRKINYGPIDPVQAREIFIRRALVEGDYETHAQFLRHNRALVEEVQLLEEKSRRRDVLIDEQQLFQFYDERIPQGVYNGHAFEKWRKEAEAGNARLLYFDRDFLMQRDASEVTEERYPDVMQVQGMSLPLQYHFGPGEEVDGISVTVPMAALNQLSAERFDWLVPGMIQEKITQLIKTLPKNLRRNFVPAPEYARACMQVLEYARGDLLDALSHQFKRMSGIEVPRSAWQPQNLPQHLQMYFQVVNAKGRIVNQGRELPALQQGLSDKVQESFSSMPVNEYEREHIERWDFGDIPEVVEIEQHGFMLQGYPALVCTRKGGEIHLSMKVMDTRDAARDAMRGGLAGLFMRVQQKEISYLQKNIPLLQKSCMHYASLGSCEELKQDMVNAIVEAALLENNGELRTEAEFSQRSAQACAQLVSIGNRYGELVATILAEYHAVARGLKGNIPLAWIPVMSDIKEQLDHLVYRGFVSTTSLEQLQHIPRYLQAIQRRLEKLQQNPQRDRQLMAEIAPLWRQYLEHAGSGRGAGSQGAELETYRWMVEELRVSLFAQELKTPAPVSVKRLEKQWKKVCV